MLVTLSVAECHPRPGQTLKFRLIGRKLHGMQASISIWCSSSRPRRSSLEVKSNASSPDDLERAVMLDTDDRSA
jgi:hypothetical protein